MTDAMVSEGSTPPRQVKPPRKGAKPGQSGTTPWQDDPDILNRVRWVGSLTWEQGQSISQIAHLLGVSEATVAADRERYRTLDRQAIKTGRDEHLRKLEMVIDEAFKAFHRLPADSVMAKRAEFLHVIQRATMDKAKLDGSLDTRPQLNLLVGIQTGPGLDDLLRQGRISDSDYEAALRIVALQEQPIDGQLALPGDVVEAAAGPDITSPTPEAVNVAASTPRAGKTPPVIEAAALTPDIAGLAEVGLASFTDEEPDEELYEDDDAE